MAHIGRFYKLQFRRDLASTERNVNGYPEAFGLTIAFLDGSLGRHISGNAYQLVNLEKNSQPPMVWLNDNIVVAGTRLKFVLTVTDQFVASEAKWTIQIKDYVSGTILFELKPMTTLGANDFSDWSYPSSVPTVQSSEIFAFGGSSPSNWSAEPWSRYNP